MEISTAKEAAGDELVLAFGRLQGAANRLEYILGRALEVECGISHLMFEVLLILGRAGEPGLSMRAIAQEQVLTTGGATRLVDRMEAAGLVERAEDPGDRRGRLVRLTPRGEETTVAAARVHVENIRRYFVAPLPAEDRDRFAEDLRILSHAARDTLPACPDTNATRTAAGRGCGSCHTRQEIPDTSVPGAAVRATDVTEGARNPAPAASARRAGREARPHEASRSPRQRSEPPTSPRPPGIRPPPPQPGGLAGRRVRARPLGPRDQRSGPSTSPGPAVRPGGGLT